MALTSEEIELYTNLLKAFKEPMSVSQHFINTKLPPSGIFNAKILKLCREGFMVVVGQERHPKNGNLISIYKSLTNEYSPSSEQKPIDFGTDFLNKMFGVNKIEPKKGRVFKEKNVSIPPRKRPKNCVSGSTLNFL